MYLPPSTAGEEILHWNFSPLHRTLLCHPAGRKFARNRSICYAFWDIDTFPFSAKIQDGRQKWRKMKFFPFGQDTLVSPCGSKIRSKSLDLLRFLRYWHFFIFSKNPRWSPKVAKNEIFPLWTEHSCITLRVKNSLEIARSLTVFEILTLFHFPQKSKMAAKSGENWNFPPLHRRLLYHPAGQKFARNRSISYGFRDIDTFLFSAKIQKWPPKVAKIDIFPLCTGHSCATLLVKNSLEIALSLMVLEIFTLFHFSQKSKMAAKSGENWNFTPLHRTFLYYLAGQKFARNRSISYGFRDIHTFSFFSAKIQDGRQKWRKLKSFPFA